MEHHDVAAGQELGTSVAQTPTGTGEPPLPPMLPPPYAAAGSDTGPRGWRKFFAVSGIVFAFFFFLTIPGWIALRTYRRWKAGERGQPNILIAWGMFSFIAYLAAFSVGLVSLPIHVREVDPLEGLTGTTGASGSVGETPLGFTASALDSGWTRYASDAEGFSIAVPPAWQTTPQVATEPDTKFMAMDLDSDGLDTPPVLVVATNAVEHGVSPALYYQLINYQFTQDPSTVGIPQLTTTDLPDGEAYVITVVQDHNSERTRLTRYGLLTHGKEYVLVFGVPVQHADEYEDVLHDIAMTFDITT